MAVVLQYYELSVQYSKSVIRGNTALLKCSIPNFVKDHITVTSWLQDSSFNIYPSIKGDGKYHMLPTGELLIQRVDETDKYRSYQCRAMNRLTATPLLSMGRARFSVTGMAIDCFLGSLHGGGSLGVPYRAFTIPGAGLRIGKNAVKSHFLSRFHAKTSVMRDCGHYILVTSTWKKARLTTQLFSVELYRFRTHYLTSLVLREIAVRDRIRQIM
ncbi:hypothetical protein J6590_009632 [Homalodisca vitripennis]|nr:hypothetical protein J6590_009632 [Homalodisca vitripennis]